MQHVIVAIRRHNKLHILLEEMSLAPWPVTLISSLLSTSLFFPLLIIIFVSAISCDKDNQQELEDIWVGSLISIKLHEIVLLSLAFVAKTLWILGSLQFRPSVRRPKVFSEEFAFAFCAAFAICLDLDPDLDVDVDVDVDLSRATVHCCLPQSLFPFSFLCVSPPNQPLSAISSFRFH